MQLKYVGPHDEVEVPSLGLVVKQGEKVEVPDEAAGGFTSQDTWRTVAAEPSKEADK